MGRKHSGGVKMIFRISGIVAVFVVCVAAGFMKSASLAKRVHDLEAFLSALTLISAEIRYFASPTDDIIAKLNSASEYKQLHVFELCRENLEYTRDFAKAWALALEKSKPYLSLDKGDFDTLTWFGSLFGTTDMQGQIANCERYCGLLEQRLDIAREDKAKRGRMYTSLGVLAGVFFAVLFF
jgi:stage III sporulation protein AB